MGKPWTTSQLHGSLSHDIVENSTREKENKRRLTLFRPLAVLEELYCSIGDEFFFFYFFYFPLKSVKDYALVQWRNESYVLQKRVFKASCARLPFLSSPFTTNTLVEWSSFISCRHVIWVKNRHSLIFVWVQKGHPFPQQKTNPVHKVYTMCEIRRRVETPLWTYCRQSSLHFLQKVVSNFPWLEPVNSRSQGNNLIVAPKFTLFSSPNH